MPPRKNYAGPEKVMVRGVSPPDPDEAIALAHVAQACHLSELQAALIISTWIIKRAELSGGKRLTENLAFDLADAKLRGIVGAALPVIAGALPQSTLDAFEYFDKAAMVDLFVTAIQAVSEVSVSMDEAPLESIKVLPIGDRECPF